MTYTPIQLEIIKRFGKKDLSFGCKVMLSNPKTGKILDTFPYTVISHSEGCYTDFIPRSTRNSNSIKSCEILGHIPEIFPDVARVAKEKGFKMAVSARELIYIYTNPSSKKLKYQEIPFEPTLPLIGQPETTLQELLSLFPNE